MALSSQDPIRYLRSLKAIRERSFSVYEKAKSNQLKHFDVDESKLDDVVTFVVSLIKRDYEHTSKIPPHSRWRHLDVGDQPRVQGLVDSWKQSCDLLEQTRRVLDLFVVSVLLDAGAGNSWTYASEGSTYRRSEGLAVASLDMFASGCFSSNPLQAHQVDADGLARLTLESVEKAFQHDEKANFLVGVKGRTELLNRLGGALKNHPNFFEQSGTFRPGNMIDYLIKHQVPKGEGTHIDIETLWDVVINGFNEIWPPSRTSINGVFLGDVWPCDTIKAEDASPDSTNHFVPFHKLSQWMTYSLMEPITKIFGATIDRSELLTGLPEYRNGGLLVDTGLLQLKPEEKERGLAFYEQHSSGNTDEVVPMFTGDDPVVVEWRALIVAYADVIADLIRENLKLSKSQMPLAMVLEGGTWKAGRELAERQRPNTKGPPIAIMSDGTLF